MKLTIVLVTAAALLAAPAQSPEVQFRAAQQKETVGGDLPKAISLYRKLADDRSTPPEIAAMSLVQIGRCYERLGSGEARRAYQRVLEQFATQQAPAAEARRRLTALTGGAREESVVVRKLQGSLQGYVSDTVVQDGRQAVVSHGRTGLDLLDLQSGDRHAIQTTEPIGPIDATIFGSSISPDGRRVVVEVSLGAGNSELRLIDMGKGTVRTLIKSDTAFRFPPLDWSRDGHIVLASPSEESALAQKTSNLALIEVESGNIHRMPVSGIVVDARLSPDNQFVAYTLTPDMRRYSRQGKRIFVARTDGSGSRLAAAPPAGGALAGWSPDSRYLLFASDDFGTDHLWAMRIRDGNPEGEPVSIAKGLARSDKLAVTASGSVILTLMGAINCYSASLDPTTGAVTARKNVNANVNAMITSAIWSPDGRRMAYSTMYNARADSTTSVYLRDLPSGEERKLGEFPLIPRKMSWTPDGKAILMPQLADKGSSVMRYWIDEDRREELAPAEAGDRSAKAYPKLARDGRTLYYLDGPPSLSNCKLIRRDLTTGNAKPIATLNLTYDLAPDGEDLVIPLFDATSKRMTIQIISNNGQIVRKLVQLGPDERVMSLAWAPDGKWIYYGLGTAAGVEIHRVAAGGGKTAFTGLRTATLPDLVVHPNGDQVAFLDTTGSELWKVDGIGSILAKLR